MSDAPETIYAWVVLGIKHVNAGYWAPSKEVEHAVEYRLASTVDALLAERDAEIERLRANLAAIEDEKNAYIDYVGDALGQAADGESLWDAAQRVLSERDRYRVIVDRLLECADSDPFGTVGHFVEHGPASVEIGCLREPIAAVEQKPEVEE